MLQPREAEHGRPALSQTYLKICAIPFSENHANLIPNLIKYGKALRATGDDMKALQIFERAMQLHQLNFSDGQNVKQLNELRYLLSGQAVAEQRPALNESCSCDDILVLLSSQTSGETRTMSTPSCYSALVFTNVEKCAWKL